MKIQFPAWQFISLCACLVFALVLAALSGYRLTVGPNGLVFEPAKAATTLPMQSLASGDPHEAIHGSVPKPFREGTLLRAYSVLVDSRRLDPGMAHPNSR